MKKNMYLYLIGISILSVLMICRSINGVASLLLVLSGSTCYMWDRKSRSNQIRKSALTSNIHLMAAGALLLLLTLASGSGTEQVSTGLTEFLWVVSYTFSLTATPVLIWQHFAKRRFHMDKARLLSAQKTKAVSNCPAFFEQRDNNHQTNSDSNNRSHNQKEMNHKQLRMAV